MASARATLFIAITQSIDTEKQDPMARFLLGLFGLLAQFEREMTLERVKAGVKDTQRRGYIPVKPAAPRMSFIPQ